MALVDSVEEALAAVDLAEAGKLGCGLRVAFMSCQSGCLNIAECLNNGICLGSVT